MTVEIKLNKGYVAIVDNCDSDLADVRWQPLYRGLNVYALRTSSANGKSVSILMHRVILSRVLGRQLERFEYVDHEKGGGLMNVRSNLRLATTVQNTQNRSSNSTSTNPYKGISWIKLSKKWGGFINIDGKQKYLGLHLDPLEMHRAYCIAALTYHKEFANFGANSPFTGWTLADFEHEAQP